LAIIAAQEARRPFASSTLDERGVVVEFNRTAAVRWRKRVGVEETGIRRIVRNFRDPVSIGAGIVSR
jgi:hypothetical protein